MENTHQNADQRTVTLPGIPDGTSSNSLTSSTDDLADVDDESNENTSSIKSAETNDDDESTTSLSSATVPDMEGPDSESHPENEAPKDASRPTSGRILSSPLTLRVPDLASDSTKGMENLKVLSISPAATPRSPSPLFGRRTPRGALGWRPVMPGYHAPKSDSQKLVYEDAQNRLGRSHNVNPDLSLKDYIPAMPKPLAVLCVVLNILFPGLGTLTAGVSVLCCSNPRPHGTERVHCLWVNTWVSVLQILTTFLLLLGWVWSIMWAAAFLAVSGKVAAEDELEGAEVRNTSVSVVGHRTGELTIATARPAHSSQDMHPRGHYHNENEPSPMIILQDAPIVVRAENPTYLQIEPRSQQRALNPYNPRHQRALQRRNTEEELLPSYLLDSQALENIVIRHAPVPDHLVFGYDDQASGSNPSLGLNKSQYQADLVALSEELDSDMDAGPSGAHTSSSMAPHHYNRNEQRRNSNLYTRTSVDSVFSETSLIQGDSSNRRSTAQINSESAPEGAHNGPRSRRAMSIDSQAQPPARHHRATRSQSTSGH